MDASLWSFSFQVRQLIFETVENVIKTRLFAYRSRGIVTGITAGLNYIMAFCTTKTYFNLETSLSLVGLITLYAVFDIFGLFYIYFFLPETERRTLEEIELHFSDNKKKLSDINIRKNVDMALEKSGKIKNGIENKAFENAAWGFTANFLCDNKQTTHQPLQVVVHQHFSFLFYCSNFFLIKIIYHWTNVFHSHLIVFEHSKKSSNYVLIKLLTIFLAYEFIYFSLENIKEKLVHFIKIDYLSLGQKKNHLKMEQQCAKFVVLDAFHKLLTYFIVIT